MHEYAVNNIHIYLIIAPSITQNLHDLRSPLRPSNVHQVQLYMNRLVYVFLEFKACINVRPLFSEFKKKYIFKTKVSNSKSFDFIMQTLNQINFLKIFLISNVMNGTTMFISTFFYDFLIDGNKYESNVWKKKNTFCYSYSVTFFIKLIAKNDNGKNHVKLQQF